MKENIRYREMGIANAMTCVLLCGLAGCPNGGGGPTGDVTDGNRDSTLTSPLGKTTGEPNDDFSKPIVAVFDSGNAARLQGTVARRGDLDVFLIGALSAGDRVLVNTATSGSSLDVSVALFDAEGRLVLANDDRCDNLDDPACLDSEVDVIIRHNGASYYLVVTQSAFGSPSQTSGSYTADVAVTRGSDVPSPLAQVLALDFDGARINSAVLGSFTLEPFDAARIDRRYEGATDELRTKIIEIVRQNYKRFNIAVIESGEQSPFDPTRASTIFFGGFNPTAFGLSEAVDLYNADFCDDAIIYAESFSPEVFSRIPNMEQLGIAIGNVASHEAGHLLGLNHVSDDLDLMDDRSPADAFIEDQEFLESPLSTDIIPIGTQDGVLLLLETVGPAE